MHALATLSLLSSLLLPQEAAPARATPAARYDLLLRNGILIDGVERRSRPGSLAIRDGKIAAIGNIAASADTPVLELGGLSIAPGFVDLHAHVDADIVRQPLAANFLRMGVTTLITGNCGSSVRDIDSHLRRLEQGGIGLNYGSLVGHGTVRSQVLGTERRAPTADELQRMQDLVAAGMRGGAFGLSTGLIYVPGTYAETEEIIALAKAVAPFGGRYATHMRNEGDRIVNSIEEALRIGREAGIPVHLSHLKCSGKANHGRAAEVLELLRAARERQPLSADQYAYDASSTGLDVLFPTAELAAGREGMAKRLRGDQAYRREIHRKLLAKMDQSGHGDFSYARIANARGNQDLNGLLLPAAAERRHGDSSRDHQAQLAIELLIAAAPNRVSMVYHSMAESDVETFLAADWIALASDSGLRSEVGAEKPHPRGSGNTVRLLGRYVRERGIVDLPTAIHKLSSLPAEQFGISDRGRLQPGQWADLVVFDPATVADAATFAEPTLPPVGIRWVLVNGVIAVADGNLTGARAGQVLRHGGRRGK